MVRTRAGAAIVAVLLGSLMAACTPTVQMAAPKEPITVNLNVKIQHEIYVKVDREVDELFTDQGLF
jgi:hypothetical protein